MAGIRVKITNEVGVATHRVEVPHDVSVGNLLKVLPQRIGRPTIDAEGRPIGYRLYHRNNELNQDRTLGQAGVNEEDEISLRAEGTAGGRHVR